MLRVAASSCATRDELRALLSHPQLLATAAVTCGRTGDDPLKNLRGLPVSTA